MSGEGEPYFVDRDNLGRVSRVIYPDATDADLPQMEMRYEYAADGQVSRISDPLVFFTPPPSTL